MNNNPPDIIRYHLKARFLKIPEKLLTDFVPCILEKNLDEMSILKTWEDHFQNRKIPYCVERTSRFINSAHRNVLTLWKKNLLKNEY